MKFLVALTALVLLSGCGPKGILKPDAPGPSAYDSIYIIGLHPKNVWVKVWPGSIHQNAFRQDVLRNATLVAPATDGYVIGRMRVSEVYALKDAVVVDDPSSTIGTPYTACRNALVFKAQPGKVIYLGDVDFAMDGDRLDPRMTYDAAAAEAFLKKRYPNIHAHVTAAHFLHMHLAGCN